MAVVAALKLILISAQRLIKGELFNGPIISTSEELLRYLMATYAFEKNECLRILFLNARNYLLADEKHSRGTVNYTHAYPREIIKRAIELNGTALIMVHNHPSGDPSPSISDIDMTKEVYKAGKIFDIVLQDHIIIANTNWVSLRVLGLIS
jgi:DNA repair protein RadC